VVQPETQPASSKTPADPLTVDLACARCGYNLRTLATDALCPECATPVSQSLLGNRLHLAAPAWLRDLRSGTVLLLVYLLLRVVVGMVTAWMSVNSQPPLYLLWCMVDVFGVVAVFRLTRPEPSSPERETVMGLRRLLRVASVVSLPARYAWVIPSIAATVPAGVGSVVGGVAILVVTIGLLIHLRRLALRIPDGVLVHHTTVVALGLGVTTVWAVTINVTGAVFGPRTIAGLLAGARTHTVIFGVFGCFTIVFYLWFVILLLNFVSSFHRVAAQASDLRVNTTGARDSDQAQMPPE